jgi:hypothetical protein
MKLESAGGKLLKGSVADGYFQFVEDTWPSYAAKAGVKAKSAKTASLTEQVKVMEEFTKANAERLRPFLGRDPSQGELYLAHHFGAGGAKTLVRAADKSPNSLAKNFVSPKAFKHNKSLIGNKTVSELIQYLDLSFEKGKFSKNHSLERQMAALR